MTLLRLHCVRCGDLCHLDPAHKWPICWICWERRPRFRAPNGAYRRWLRWRRGIENHATTRALFAALDALEAT